MFRKAFTLIELLVVIAIIAILAAILFPVFAQAKLAAKKAADLSNSKQLGTSLQIYITDYDDFYPVNNHRVSNGVVELHWSWMILPYVKNEQIFVSPVDKNGGWAPSCFDASTNNRGFGVPGVQNNGCVAQGYGAGQFTIQVGRLSYTGNQLLMPRKRSDADTSTAINSTVVDGVADTILIAPMTESIECMRRGGPTGEARTYRPTLGVRDSASITNSFSNALPATSQLWALQEAEARTIFACNTGTPGASSVDHVLRYTHPGRFGNGNNYVYADSHAKFADFYRTLNPRQFQWGKAGYSIGGATVIDRATGLPVQ
jgi:prepilin-type N-terminal cleavage/methylation domain-containing protein